MILKQLVRTAQIIIEDIPYSEFLQCAIFIVIVATHTLTLFIMALINNRNLFNLTVGNLQARGFNHDVPLHIAIKNSCLTTGEADMTYLLKFK